jgi:phosphatidylserine/phosphatidylglycerophosphate/cardiolipin synthase-like enzyme
VILIDGRKGFLGSENISTQSLDLNREIGVFIRGSAVREIGRVFEHDWHHGLLVPLSGS